MSTGQRPPVLGLRRVLGPRRVGHLGMSILGMALLGMSILGTPLDVRRVGGDRTDTGEHG